jgi:hypothetical protein
VVRHESPRRVLLLAIRPSTQAHRGVPSVPLLPILSPSPKALNESGLLPYVDLPISTAEPADDQATGAATHLLSPDGPWHLHGAIKIPEGVFHLSTKHPMSNTVVRHSLKFFLRVERGDEDDLDSKGNKKQYDIIVEMPVSILSVGAISISWHGADPAGFCSITVELKKLPCLNMKQVRPIMPPQAARRVSPSTPTKLPSSLSRVSQTVAHQLEELSWTMSPGRGLASSLRDSSPDLKTNKANILHHIPNPKGHHHLLLFLLRTLTSHSRHWKELNQGPAEPPQARTNPFSEKGQLIYRC